MTPYGSACGRARSPGRYNARVGRALPLWLVITLTLLPARAEEPVSLGKHVEAVVESLRLRYFALMQGARTKEERAVAVAEFEKARAAAARKLEALIAPRGELEELPFDDLSPACEALLRWPLAPPDDAVLELAPRLLLLDVTSPFCWDYLDSVVSHFASTRRAAGVPWDRLRTWSRETRGRPGIRAGAQRALELLEARAALELGDRRGARRIAELLLDGGKGSESLREAALEIRSRAALLGVGREAPHFDLPALEAGKQHRSRDLRGRVLLLYFRHENDITLAYDRLVEKCREKIPRSQLSILVVPLGVTAAEHEALVYEQRSRGWPFAAPGEVSVDVARAFGAEAISALFLLSPEGRVGLVLPQPGGERIGLGTVREIVNETMGPPLEMTLGQLGGAGSWSDFRRTWHGLLDRNRRSFEPSTWQAARAAGNRARLALLLASNPGEAADAARKTLDGSADPHVRLVLAWLDRVAGGGWKQATAALAKPQSDECLSVLDRLYDLGLRGEDLVPVLERAAARGKRWEPISMALRALAFQETVTSPRALRRLAKHKRWQVRLALAEGLRAYRHKESVDLLITLVGDKRIRVRESANESLELLTGQVRGTSQKRWKKWRQAQGADVRLIPREISRLRPYRKRDRRYAPRGYFGVHVASNRMVYVLDKSESMFYGLFDGVVDEMSAQLASAGPTTKFNVIEFDAAPRIWQTKLQPANAANVRKAVAFLQRSKPYGPTNVIDSLRLGMRVADLDSIVFLSDGLPNRGDPAQPDPIRSSVAVENRYLRIAIHTVLLLRGRSFPHDGPRGKEIPPLDEKEKARRAWLREQAPVLALGNFLKRLARENDGTFGVGFADSWRPPPGAATRPSTDK